MVLYDLLVGSVVYIKWKWDMNLMFGVVKKEKIWLGILDE